MNDTPRTPPETFLLLKFGRSVYTKDGKEGGFDFDAPAAEYAMNHGDCSIPAGKTVQNGY